MIELYEKPAKASFENAISVYEESEILSKNSRFARAYALCVLSAEEHYKHFLYKSVSAGLIPELLVSHWIMDHEEKIFGLYHLVLTPWVLSYHFKEIKSATEHDKMEPDHSKHIFPNVMDSITSFYIQGCLNTQTQSLLCGHRERKCDNSEQRKLES